MTCLFFGHKKDNLVYDLAFLVTERQLVLIGPSPPNNPAIAVPNKYKLSP